MGSQHRVHFILYVLLLGAQMQCLGSLTPERWLLSMGVHTEAVSLVDWYQDDAHRLRGKVVAAESLIFFFFLL